MHLCHLLTYQCQFITQFNLPEISLTSMRVAFGNFNLSLFLIFSSPGLVDDVEAPPLWHLTLINLSLLMRRKTDAHRNCDCFTAIYKNNNINKHRHVSASERKMKLTTALYKVLNNCSRDQETCDTGSYPSAQRCK